MKTESIHLAMKAGFKSIPSSVVGVDFWQHKAVKNVYAFTPVKYEEKIEKRIGLVRCDKIEDLSRPAFIHFSVSLAFNDYLDLVTIINSIR